MAEKKVKRLAIKISGSEDLAVLDPVQITSDVIETNIPDASSTASGKTLLSDDVNSDLDALNGKTAATPKAVKSVAGQIGSLGDLATEAKGNLVTAINEVKAALDSGTGVTVQDATDKIKGVVLLSDSVNSDVNAATGKTAATPKAVKTVDSKIGNLNDLSTTDKTSVVNAINELKTTGGGGGDVPGPGVVVLTPKVLMPFVGQTNVGTRVYIQGTPYANAFQNDLRKFRKFQVSKEASFSSSVVNVEHNGDSYTHSTALETDTQYYVRIKDVSRGGTESAWSAAVSFTTASSVSKVLPPEVRVDNASAGIGSGPLLIGSGFVTTGGESDTHQYTDWEIKNEDASESVWKAQNSTSLISIKVPDNTLKPSVTYTVHVRYKGSKLGWSDYTVIKITTAEDFGKVATPDVHVTGSPANVKDGAMISTTAFSVLRGTDTHQATDWEIRKYGGDGGVVFNSLNDTKNLTILSTPLRTFEPNTTYVANVRHKGAKFGWSDWGSYRFTTAENVTMNPEVSPNVPTKGIHFTIAYDLNRSNIFRTAYQPSSSNFKVSVNGEVTDQSLYSLNVKAGDEILIECLSGKFPTVNFDSWRDYFKAFLSPLPTMYVSQDKKLTNELTVWFKDAAKLESLCDDFFGNNPQIQFPYYAFQGCKLLKTVGARCFAGNKTKVFYNIFHSCPELQSVGDECFKGVGDGTCSIHYTLRDCPKLTHIGDRCFADITASTQLRDGVIYSLNSITTLPDNLFENSTGIHTLSNTCYDLPKLTSMPLNPFRDLINLQTLENVLCSAGYSAPVEYDSVVDLPADMLKNCPKLSVCRYTLTYANKLVRSVPADFFKHNPELTDVSGLFRYWGNKSYNSKCVKEIPADLFRHNPKISSAEYMFAYSLDLKIPKEIFAPVTEASSINCYCLLYDRAHSSAADKNKTTLRFSVNKLSGSYVTNTSGSDNTDTTVAFEVPRGGSYSFTSSSVNLIYYDKEN